MKFSWKKIAFGFCGIAALAAAALTVVQFAKSDNDPLKLWGTDDTSFHIVATNAKSPEPTRETPVVIAAQVERLYGLHLGTPIKVRYFVRSLTGTQIRFDTLLKGVLSRYKTTWRLVDVPHVVSETNTKDGYINRVVELTVAVWESPVPPQPAAPSTDGDAAPAAAAAPTEGPPKDKELWPFAVEFLFSTEKMADGRQWKWEYIETPEIKFGFASLLDPGADPKAAPGGDGFDLGPVGDIPDHYNTGGLALIGVGSLMVVSGLGFGLLWLRAWLRRRRMPKELPVAIRLYKDAIARARDTKDLRPYAEQIRVAVRDRLGGAAYADAALAELWEGHPLHTRIVAALKALDDAVRNRGWLDNYSERQVLALIAQLDAMELAASSSKVARLTSGVKRLFAWRPRRLSATGG